jgi:hypothetical protein
LEKSRTATLKQTLLHHKPFVALKSSNIRQNGSRTPEEEEQVFNSQEAPKWTLEEEAAAEPDYCEALV